MNKLKKISWLVVSLVALFFAYGATANQSYGDWKIEGEFTPLVLFMENEHSEKIVITCADSGYLTSVFLPDHTEGDKEAFFDYQIDNQSVIFEGKNFAQSWFLSGVLFDDEGHVMFGEVDKYKALFQNMQQAKQSLTVNLIDAKGHIYRSANFSVKGLPEALVELAKQCGTDFQTYSGIDINQVKE